MPRGLFEILPVDTALAAHLHHRVSRDLDFFAAVDLDVPELRGMLDFIGNVRRHETDDHHRPGRVSGEI